MRIQSISAKKIATLAILVGTLSACGGSDNDGVEIDIPPIPMATFQVTVVNGTAGQPLSPLAVAAHMPTVQAFTLGQPASVGLEMLAEGGDNTSFVAELDAVTDVFATAGGEGAIGPGATGMVMIEVPESSLAELRMSFVSMLVNTNDAITALNSLDVSNMEVGDSVSATTGSYDTGTEANSEAMGTIPGPAVMGAGFDATRDDIADIITAHPGVISGDDGLAGSVLTTIHRWDNPTTFVTVSRVE